MTEENKLKGFTFNIIKHRGDPATAVTLTGDEVKKESHIYFADPEGKYVGVACADYHNEHFVYLDPLYMKGKEGKGHWFAMCTCGSPAVIVGPGEPIGLGEVTDRNTLVCMMYTATFQQFGVGKHVTSKRDIERLLGQA